MRKNDDQEISSLDMLLDTMCNTFGGIVFIALLISILSTSLAKQDRDSTKTRKDTIVETDRHIEAGRLVREEQKLKAAINQLKLSRIQTPPEHDNIYGELASLVASNELSLSEVEVLKNTNAILANAISVAEEATRNNTISESDLRASIAKSQDQAESVRRESVRTVRLPRLHSIEGKRPVFVAIKDRKFYAVTALTRLHDSSDKYDSEDVAVEQGPGMAVIELRQNAGQFVTVNCENKGKISIFLSRIDPATDFIAFAVDKNSFSEFNYVKALFVNKGFEYNWTIQEGALQIVTTSEAAKVQ